MERDRMAGDAFTRDLFSWLNQSRGRACTADRPGAAGRAGGEGIPRHNARTRCFGRHPQEVARKWRSDIERPSRLEDARPAAQGADAMTRRRASSRPADLVEPTGTMADPAVVKKILVLIAELRARQDATDQRLDAIGQPVRTAPAGWLGPKAAAAIAGVSRQSVRQWCADGSVIYRQVKSRFYIEPASLRARALLVSASKQQAGRRGMAGMKG
jgi:hypothetical protein